MSFRNDGAQLNSKFALLKNISNLKVTSHLQLDSELADSDEFDSMNAYNAYMEGLESMTATAEETPSVSREDISST